MSGETRNITTPDRKGLREFGLVTGAIIAGLFGLLLPFLFALAYPLWPWIVFAILGLWALLGPSTLGGVYLGWMRFGLLLSKVTTPIIMGTVFFLVISPIALILKLIKWDAMMRRLDDDAETYRLESPQSENHNLDRPF